MWGEQKLLGQGNWGWCGRGRFRPGWRLRMPRRRVQPPSRGHKESCWREWALRMIPLSCLEWVPTRKTLHRVRASHPNTHMYIDMCMHKQATAHVHVHTGTEVHIYVHKATGICIHAHRPGYMCTHTWQYTHTHLRQCVYMDSVHLDTGMHIGGKMSRKCQGGRGQ